MILVFLGRSRVMIKSLGESKVLNLLSPVESASLAKFFPLSLGLPLVCRNFSDHVTVF